MACAAALATMEVIEEENLASNAQVVGDYLREKLEERNIRWWATCVGWA